MSLLFIGGEYLTDIHPNHMFVPDDNLSGQRQVCSEDLAPKPGDIGATEP